jgi:hypothetical protein
MGALPSKTIKAMYFDNGCELSPWIRSVSGVAGGTMSVSDQWIITLHPERVTYQERFLNRVFVKIIPNIIHPNEDTNLRIQDLLSEVKIYGDVIKPIIDKKICPFFLPVINVTYNCSASSLIEMLRDKSPDENFRLKVPPEKSEPFDPETVFVRNMALTLHSLILEEETVAVCIQPDIEIKNRNQQYPKEEHVDSISFLKQFTTGAPVAVLTDSNNNNCIQKYRNSILEHPYTLLYTQPIEGNETVYRYILQLGEDHDTHGMFFLCFQMSIAFATMHSSKLLHSDLHLNNILMKTLDQHEKVMYIVEDVLFTYVNRKIPIVFDFDRSNAKRHFNNKFEEIRLRSDLWGFFLDLYVLFVNPEWKDAVISCVFKPRYQEQARQYWDSLYTKYGPDENYVYIGRRKTDVERMNMYTDDPVQIIINWAKASGVVKIAPVVEVPLDELMDNRARRYIYRSSFFDSDTGVIIEEDPFSCLYGYAQTIYLPENTQEIIDRKHILARQNLKLLQLKLQLQRQQELKKPV